MSAPIAIPSSLNGTSSNAMSLSTSSPSSLCRADILKLLDIAESAAKMVPGVGNMLEGAIGTVRKILEALDSMRKSKSECLALAERAALYVYSVSTEVARLPPGQDTDDRVMNLVQCLLEIEEYMTSLSHTSGVRRIATSKAILAEIDSFNTKLQDAVSVFQLTAERMLGEISMSNRALLTVDYSTRNDIAMTIDAVVRASSVSTETLLAVLAIKENNVVAAIEKNHKEALAVLAAQRQPALPATTAFDDPITIIDSFLFVPQHMLFKRPGAFFFWIPGHPIATNRLRTIRRLLGYSEWISEDQ